MVQPSTTTDSLVLMLRWLRYIRENKHDDISVSTAVLILMRFTSLWRKKNQNYDYIELVTGVDFFQWVCQPKINFFYKTLLTFALRHCGSFLLAIPRSLVVWYCCLPLCFRHRSARAPSSWRCLLMWPAKDSSSMCHACDRKRFCSLLQQMCPTFLIEYLQTRRNAPFT